MTSSVKKGYRAKARVAEETAPCRGRSLRMALGCEVVEPCRQYAIDHNLGGECGEI